MKWIKLKDCQIQYVCVLSVVIMCRVCFLTCDRNLQSIVSLSATGPIGVMTNGNTCSKFWDEKEGI